MVLLAIPLLQICIVLVVVGLVLWLVNSKIPMDGTIKQILNIVVIVAVIVWLLQVTGAWDYLSEVG